MPDLLEEERTTCHHLGNGHGPVNDEEIIALAVFTSTPKNGRKLVADSFPRKQLITGNLSLARRSYTSTAEFTSHVLEPAITRGEVVEGASWALVSDIRRCVVVAPDPEKLDQLVRGVCVLDIVTAGDHEGHAALKFATLPARTPERRIGTLRTMIREQLAERFSEIGTCEAVWAIAS